MSQSKQIKLFSLLLALVIAVVSTVMLLGIQINFNQDEHSAKIGAPVILVVLIALLIVYKFVTKQKKANMMAKLQEKKGKKLGPYMSIFFTYFDFILLCGILSSLFWIVKGIFKSLYEKMLFDWIVAWEYTSGRLAIVFIIYIGCLLIYTIGLMAAYFVDHRGEAK